MTSSDDRLLFQKIRDGDVKAFKSLFETFYASLCHYAVHFLNDDDHAREVVQIVFVRLWEKRHTLDISVSLRRYLFRAVRNECINTLQKEKGRKIYTAKLADTYPEDEEDPAIFSTDVMLKLEEAISSLPRNRREIFRLSREKGMKYREIAAEMNISVKTVEAQMGLALKTLREKLRNMTIFY